MIGNAGILEHTNMTSAKMIKAPEKLEICDTIAKSAVYDIPSYAKSKTAEIMSAGTCETKPSPSVKGVQVQKA